MSDEMMSDEVTPDALMENFKGKGVMAIVVFTVIVHLVLIIGTSVTYLWKKVGGEKTSEMTEEQRMDSAIEDATEALREIAEEHGLHPNDLSSKLGGGSRTVASPATEPADDTSAAVADDAEPEREKSEYEKKLETAAEGPKVPSFDTGKDDIF